MAGTPTGPSAPRPVPVPGNRWDLALDALRPPDSVAVVVPYFEQPASLRRLYAALLADSGRARVDVVVVDDGSDRPPPPPPRELRRRVAIVRQEDRGCRPGAARNLGVAHTEAETLVFLDADTLPQPGTIDRLARWPASIADALVVGRRRHAQLDGWSGEAVRDWLTGRGPAPRPRRDPAWLADGYRATADLLHADRRSYRYVISAVMACDRTLFDDLGGFSEERDRYGGEDWELASRAYDAGAVLVHDPHAVAWHDEPDVADRGDPGADPGGDPAGDKDDETLWLAAHLRDPQARPSALRMSRPCWRVVLDLPAATPLATWVATLDAVLAELPDATVELGAHAPAAIRRFARDDARVGDGPNDGAVADVYVIAAVALGPGALRRRVERLVEHDLGTLDVIDTRGRLVRIVNGRRIGRHRRQRRRRAGSGSWFADVTDPAGSDMRRLDDRIGLAGYFERAARPLPRQPSA